MPQAAVGAAPADAQALARLPRSWANRAAGLSTRLPMGAEGGKVTCCGLWVQRSNPGCYSLFDQSSGVGSREARLSPING